MSLIHEAKRLASSSKTTKMTRQQQQSLAEYTVDFNLRGLHTIERQVFLPRIRDTVVSAAEAQHQEMLLPQAVSSVMDVLEAKRQSLEDLGAQLLESVRKKEEQASSLSSILEEKASDMVRMATQMQGLSERLVVPTVARLVPAAAQKRLNQRVLASLGLWDSRLHLVGMHEALVGRGDDEYGLFQKTIPRIWQMLIPRWKRQLYQPRVSGEL